MNSIDKIILKLETTKLGFTVNSLKKDGECSYCAEGVLAKGIIPSWSMEEVYSDLHDACLDEDIYQERLLKRYNVDFAEEYEDPLCCIFCNNGLFYTISDVITHINDHHAINHKEVAQRLKELSRVYDLIEGKPIG